jgi:hypothetical protein
MRSKKILKIPELVKKYIVESRAMAKEIPLRRVAVNQGY